MELNWSTWEIWFSTIFNHENISKKKTEEWKKAVEHVFSLGWPYIVVYTHTVQVQVIQLSEHVLVEVEQLWILFKILCMFFYSGYFCFSRVVVFSLKNSNVLIVSSIDVTVCYCAFGARALSFYFLSLFQSISTVFYIPLHLYCVFLSFRCRTGNCE